MRYDCTDCNWSANKTNDRSMTDLIDLVIDHHVDHGHSIEQAEPQP